MTETRKSAQALAGGIVAIVGVTMMICGLPFAFTNTGTALAIMLAGGVLGVIGVITDALSRNR